MKNNKVDRRVKYTKMILKQSFVSLLKTKPIAKISIKEICDIADINRATFYSHYTDQHDLLKQVENELLNDINIYLDSLSFDNNDTEAFQIMCKIFEYIKENSELCSVLLGINGDREFQKNVMMIVQKQCISRWTNKDVNLEIAEYIYSFAASGSIEIIQKWLQSGMDRSTNEMGELVLKLANQGLSAYM